MYATHLSNKINLKHLNFGSVTAVFDWKQAEATIMPGAHYRALNCDISFYISRPYQYYFPLFVQWFGHRPA